ncbi:TauD/TfdA dioxygenase family protein [Paracraurococcus lichenis]|uniref:TauD/TfdA family dioxygenase n=1 Tax=Paracraurococcus lichenis TaxID=3064888 RepID=A0ABT9E5H2_9PROT|nr:TauD/TfdA family dioxygenase [Paracraurococcus sp. LOR1-02]MDO9711240.1 TauD/TfdA family dioxygenase [Paracraurococcus sp. LOR1-02]
MPLSLHPLHPVFAAEASGLDLRRPLAQAELDAIVDAMDRYAVLLFRDQPMTEQEQIAFARRFGPLNPGLKQIGRQQERMAEQAMIDISNLGPDGRPLPRESKKILSGLANQLWHSDSSFQAPAVSYSMLSAVRLPSWGGETEFADLRAAWDALPARLQRQVEGLEAEHYALHSRMTLLGDTDYTPEQQAALPPVIWPLVRVHPGSGRKALFAGIHARRILGMGLAEGKMLLLDLLEHATDKAWRWTHRWQVGDLLIWDNRCTLHRGRAYDLDEVRELRRTTNNEVPREQMQAA